MSATVRKKRRLTVAAEVWAAVMREIRATNKALGKSKIASRVLRNARRRQQYSE